MVAHLLKNHSYKLSLAWALLIFTLCAMPGRYVPSVSWLEMLSFDKFVHAGIFFVLVSLLGIAVRSHSQTPGLFYLYFLLCVLYGGGLEIMQAKVFSERSADWYDVIANSFGCVVGVLASNKLSAVLLK